jgi:hypothetical protein
VLGGERFIERVRRRIGRREKGVRRDICYSLLLNVAGI